MSLAEMTEMLVLKLFKIQPDIAFQPDQFSLHKVVRFCKKGLMMDSTRHSYLYIQGKRGIHSETTYVLGNPASVHSSNYNHLACNYSPHYKQIQVLSDQLLFINYSTVDHLFSYTAAPSSCFATSYLLIGKHLFPDSAKPEINIQKQLGERSL